MIKAKHNKALELFFDVLFIFLIRKNFRKMQIIHDLDPGKEPVLLIANHFSWWDGFIAQRVNNLVFKRKMHVMMLEEELHKRPFLRKLGAFSIRKGSRGALESLHYASEILTRPQNLLLLFPQGRFESTHRYPVNFEKGWFRILEKAPANTRVVFMASLCDYFEYRKPALNVYLKLAGPVNDSTGQSSVPADGQVHASPGKRGDPADGTAGQYFFADAASVEQAYNRFLKEAIEAQEQEASGRFRTD